MYPSQRNYKCGEETENDCVDSSLYPLTPNKATLNSIPETPPSLRTGCNTFVYLRRDGRRKRYNRLSSSSEGEEEKNESKGENLAPRKMIKSHTPVTVFSKLSTSKRKKRILEDDTDDMDREVVGSVDLACTKETSTMYERVPSYLKQGEEDVRTLCDMFPQYQRSSLEAMLSSNNGNLDKAVSSLVGQ